MWEYRLKAMPAPLKEKLEEKNIQIVEEKFKNRKSWLIYAARGIDKMLDAFDVNFEKKNVSDTGWDNLWKNYLEEGWLTDTTYYCFDDKKFDDGRDVIHINPALAFGTGTHATTQIAARLLEKAVKGQKVLDIGTGSGILAILASIKGAKTVYACDNDDTAINNTKENVSLNKCRNIHLWAGDVDSISPKLKPTVVVANIITSVLIPLHPRVLTWQPKYIVYSGIMHKEGTDFIKTICNPGYQFDEILHMDKWCGIRLKRKEYRTREPYV